MNNHKHQEHETEFYFTVNVVHCQTSLSVLIVGPKCTPVTLCAAPGEYADGTERQTDGRTTDRYITLSAMDAASVIICKENLDL